MAVLTHLALSGELCVPIERLASPRATLVPGDRAWAQGSAAGSPLLLPLPRPLKKPLDLRNTGASRSWDHEHGPCWWKWIPVEPCGTTILEVVWPEAEFLCTSAESRLSESSTYCSAFVQVTKRSTLLASYLQLPKFPHLLWGDIKTFLIYGLKSLIALKCCDNSSL